MTELAPDDDLPEWHLVKKNTGRMTLDGRYTGHIYTDNQTGETVYVTFKRETNMFGKLSSHAIEVSILEDITEEWDVDKIVVFEDTGTVYVFNIETYIECEDEIEYEPFGPQKAPSVTQCMESYEGVDSVVRERYPKEVKLEK